MPYRDGRRESYNRVSKSVNSPRTMRCFTRAGTGSGGTFGRPASGGASIPSSAASRSSSGSSGAAASVPRGGRGAGPCDGREMLSAAVACGGGGEGSSAEALLDLLQATLDQPLDRLGEIRGRRRSVVRPLGLGLGLGLGLRIRPQCSIYAVYKSALPARDADAQFPGLAPEFRQASLLKGTTCDRHNPVDLAGCT